MLNRHQQGLIQRAEVQAGDLAAGYTAEKLTQKAALFALAQGRSQVVTGWGNKAYTFAGARVPKPVAARIAAKVLARRRPETPL